MTILKWICFIIFCTDAISYVVETSDRIRYDNKTSRQIGGLIGLFVGVAARVIVLYGAATCWLMV